MYFNITKIAGPATFVTSQTRLEEEERAYGIADFSAVAFKIVGLVSEDTCPTGGGGKSL
jgi:hypothetical protein